VTPFQIGRQGVWAGKTAMSDFDRIAQDPDVMGGRPCIRGMRVDMVVGRIGAGRR
jgi:uncharacterized protein (DUF433 family)